MESRDYKVSGAFFKTDVNVWRYSTSAVHDAYGLGINAKLSNSIYGNSDIVQPETLRSFYVIKY